MEETSLIEEKHRLREIEKSPYEQLNLFFQAISTNG